MINYSGFIISFILGFYIHKYKEKILSFLKQIIFLIRNYKAIKKSTYYNDFYEDYISSTDFEKESDKLG